jgi:ferredoxin
LIGTMLARSRSPCFSRLGSITFIGKDGAKQALKFDSGQVLYELVTAANIVDGSATCGGNLMCGRCKVVYVSGKIPPPGDDEKDLIDGFPAGTRQACAITLDDSADGAVFKAI